MRLKLTFFACFFILVIFTTCTSVDNIVVLKKGQGLQKNIRVAVLPFGDASGKENSGTAVADALVTQMIKISNWELVERAMIDKIIDEQELSLTDLTEDDYSKIGQLSNTDFIIVGNVAEFKYYRKAFVVPSTKISFHARIINSETGTIAGTVQYTLESGKNAWIGCCFLGWYYVPLALLSSEDINKGINKAAKAIVAEIKKQLKKLK